MSNYIKYEEENFFMDDKGDLQRFPNESETPTVDLSIIVPSYNEELRLPVMMDEAMSYLENLQNLEKTKYEIIIVDDGSTDKTAEIGYNYTKKYGDNKVRVLKLKRNRGKGGAIRLGMQSARGEYLLFADADGASKFSDLSKLRIALKDITNNSKEGKGWQCQGIAVGSRSHLEKESTATRSIFRTILMYGFHFLVWLFCVRGIKDTQCGFKLFTRRSAHVLFSIMHVERWAFDVELLKLAEVLQIPMKEVAVTWHEVDGSKITPVITWIEMGIDIFLIWFRYRVGIWTLQLKND